MRLQLWDRVENFIGKGAFAIMFFNIMSSAACPSWHIYIMQGRINSDSLDAQTYFFASHYYCSVGFTGAQNDIYYCNL